MPLSYPTEAGKSPWMFIGAVFLLSLPFWLAGALVAEWDLPIDLPVSALQAFVPLIAATLFLRREGGPRAVRRLLRRTFDFRRIQNKAWYLPLIGLWPLIILLSYAAMKLVGEPLPEPSIPTARLPLFLLIFFVTAATEELGWQGFLVDRRMTGWNAIWASVLIGTVWGLWHVVPFFQTARRPEWILWQVIGMVPFRMLIVWLYQNTGMSVFGVSIFHAMSNVSQFSFPNLGSHYDPFYAFIFLALATAVVLAFWKPVTLTPASIVSEYNK